MQISLSARLNGPWTHFFSTGAKYVPGFGQRFHPIDPRVPRLLELVDRSADAGHVTGEFAVIGRAVETVLERKKGRRIPMNIDGGPQLSMPNWGFLHHWHVACSASRARLASWQTPGNKPSRAVAIRGQSHAI